MFWPKRIILVRHGESEGNIKSLDDESFTDKANHRFVLTEKGRLQATAVGEYLRREYPPFDVCFCSTFRRTQETLSLVCPEATPIIDSRLNEMWRGIWHTMSRERVAELYPDEVVIKKREGPYHYRAPGGQCCQDVENMIHSFIQTLRTDWTGKNLLVVAHGNWMILFWRIILGKPPSEYERRYAEDRYHNGSITVYEGIGGQPQLFLPVENFVL